MKLFLPFVFAAGLVAQQVQITGLECTPCELKPGDVSHCVVTVTGNPAPKTVTVCVAYGASKQCADFTLFEAGITLQVNGPQELEWPAQVVFPPGSNQGTFEVRRPASSTTSASLYQLQVPQYPSTTKLSRVLFAVQEYWAENIQGALDVK